MDFEVASLQSKNQIQKTTNPYKMRVILILMMNSAILRKEVLEAEEKGPKPGELD